MCARDHNVQVTHYVCVCVCVCMCVCARACMCECACVRAQWSPAGGCCSPLDECAGGRRRLQGGDRDRERGGTGQRKGRNMPASSSMRMPASARAREAGAHTPASALRPPAAGSRPGEGSSWKPAALPAQSRRGVHARERPGAGIWRAGHGPAAARQGTARGRRSTAERIKPCQMLCKARPHRRRAGSACGTRLTCAEQQERSCRQRCAVHHAGTRPACVRRTVSPLGSRTRQRAPGWGARAARQQQSRPARGRTLRRAARPEAGHRRRPAAPCAHPLACPQAELGFRPPVLFVD